MVDAIVSPQGLVVMMPGEKPLPVATAEATDSSTQEQANWADKVETKMGYDGHSIELPEELKELGRFTVQFSRLLIHLEIDPTIFCNEIKD